jgi:hypothetical protein
VPLHAARADLARAPPASSSRPYVRRTPEKTALHLLVSEHLETFLATVREERGKDLPYYGRFGAPTAIPMTAFAGVLA